MGTWIRPQVFKADMIHLLFSEHRLPKEKCYHSLTVESHISESYIEVFMKTNHRKDIKLM